MPHHIPSHSAFDETHYDNPPNYIVLNGDRSVFTSPVEPYAPPFAEEDVDRQFGEDFISLSEAFQFHRNLSRYPQLAYIPRHPQFVHPLLRRLGCYKVVQGPNGRYQLEPELMKSWISLEDTLTAAISILSANLLLPLTVNFFPYPAEYRYRRSYVTHHRAVKAVKSSRDAFIVLLGLFSMFFSLRAERHYRYTVRPNTDRAPSVEDMLKQPGFLSDTTVQDLIDMHAVLGTRIGFALNRSDCAWFQQYRLSLMYSGVRFWIYWGKADEKLVPHLKQTVIKPSPFFHHIPDHMALGDCVYYIRKHGWSSITSNQARMLINRRAQPTEPQDVQAEPTQPVLPEQPVLPDAQPEAPEPIPTVQKPTESPLEFVERRQRQAEETKQKADDSQLQRFESYAREAARRGWTKRSKVYHWPTVGGVRRRTLAQGCDVEWCWDNTQDSDDRTPGQRKFNDVFNEWDICTDFDPMESPPEIEEKANTPPPSPKPLPHSSNLVSARLPVKSLPRDHDKQALVFSHATGVQDQPIMMPELDVLMYDRFGFDVRLISEELKQGTLTPTDETLSIEEVAGILMEKNAVASKTAGRGVCHAVTLIDQGVSIPNRFWDLKNSQLEEDNPRYFTFSALKLCCDEFDKVLEGYLVTPTSTSYVKPWFLFVKSAVAVTQCIREGWGPSLEDVVREACERGYRTHVFVKEASPVPRRASPPHLFSPRLRPEDFKPSHFDFHAYQDSVGVLLMQQRLKVAALRGGILARICSLYFAVDDLLDGPSPDVLRYGLRWRAHGEDFVYIEDFISEDEIQLLCGFFHMDCSGTGGRARQTKLMSFFPTPDVWESSGIHPGMWSNSGEQKFRDIMKRLDPEVGQGSLEPILVPIKASAEWKSNLRLYVKKTKRFLAFIEHEARSFIAKL